MLLIEKLLQNNYFGRNTSKNAVIFIEKLQKSPNTVSDFDPFLRLF